jgi:hypothetical protein
MLTSLNFWGGQDGKVEREFIGRLIDVFCNNPNVLRAYLARVQYEHKTDFNVALCIRSSGLDNNPIEVCVGTIFSSMFGSHEHLDILFVNEQQEQDLKRACKPFYCKDPSNPSGPN